MRAKSKAKVKLGNPKSDCGRSREWALMLFITKFKSQLKQSFTKVVVTRAGRLRESGQKESFYCIICK